MSTHLVSNRKAWSVWSIWVLARNGLIHLRNTPVRPQALELGCINSGNYPLTSSNGQLAFPLRHRDRKRWSTYQTI